MTEIIPIRSSDWYEWLLRGANALDLSYAFVLFPVLFAP